MSKKNAVVAAVPPAPIAAPKAKVRKHEVIVASAKDAAAKTPVSKPKTDVAKAEAKPKEKTPSKYISRDLVLGRRMRVAEYQDYTFSINDQKDRRLTDEELCTDWQKQFPQAVQFQTFHVRGARRDFNAGVHSKAFTGIHESKPWFVVNGARVQGEYARTVRATGNGGEAAPKTMAADKKTAPKAASKPAPKAEVKPVTVKRTRTAA